MAIVRIRFFISASFIGTILFTGCVDRQTVKVDDTDAIFPSLRITAGERLFDQHESEDGRNGKEVRWSLLGELDVSYGDGSSSQSLLGGETISIDSTALTGPSELDNDFSLVVGSLSGRGGVWLGGIFGIEGILGFGFMDSEIEVGAGTGAIDVSREETNWGLLAGAQATLRPLPWLDVYARYTDLGGVDFEEGDSGVESYEFGVSVRLNKQYGLALMSGWRHWEVEETESGDSSVEAELSGPFVGLHIGF